MRVSIICQCDSSYKVDDKFRGGNQRFNIWGPVMTSQRTRKDIIPVADQQHSFEQSKHYKSMLNFGRSGNKTEEYKL